MNRESVAISPRQRLHAFVGEWATRMIGPPPWPSRGRTTIEWMPDAPLLVVRSTVELPEAPTNISVIGCDGKGETYTMLYTDERDVQRILQMTLDDAGRWTLLREGTPFSQRFVGQFSDDRRSITGRWEMNRDGTWTTDFEMTYTKLR